MSLILYAGLAFAFAGAAVAFRRRERSAGAIGLVGLAVAVAAAFSIDPGQTFAIGEGGLVATPYLRLFLVLGSVVGLGAAVVGLAAGTRRDAPAVTLAILGASALTMALVDPGSAVLVATAGGVAGVVMTLLPRGARAGATVGIREARAVVIAGALAIAATAWFSRDLGALAVQPVVFGLAYLAFAVAVAIRFGAIPFHLWAARLSDVVPETSLPILTALAPASLAIVALAWVEAAVIPLQEDLTPERAIVLAIAVASIVLAAVAAFLQDDLEHILGYSIVGDAGVVILALAVLEPGAWGPARIWILAFVVARCAFAAWIAGVRTGLWTGRVADLRGWARRSPILAVAFLVIALASVGLPGFAAFDARTDLAQLALDQPFSIALVIAMLAPLVWYGRLFVIGVLRPDRVLEPVDAWRPRIGAPGPGGVRGWVADTWDRNRAFTTASMAGLLAVLALATAVGGFDVRGAAGGPPPVIGEPVESAEPSATPSPAGSPTPSPSGAAPSPAAAGSPTSPPATSPAASASTGSPSSAAPSAPSASAVPSASADAPSPSAVVPGAAP